MSKFKLIGILVVIVALVAAGCGGNVVATVNGEKITRQQLDENVTEMKKAWESQGIDFSSTEAKGLVEMLEAQTLTQLIDQELLLQEAEKQGVKPSKQQVEEEMKNFRANFDSEAKFKQFLAANGLSEPKLLDLVEKDMAMQALQKKVLGDVKKVSDAEARAYYEGNKEQFAEPEQRQVRHILIMTKEGDNSQSAEVEAKTQALAILEQLNQGKDFATLAKEKSQDQATREDGGLYTFKRGDAVPEFEEAAFALKPGEITKEPVKTQYGYHIIKLEKVIPSAIKPYDEVKNDLVQFLSDKAQQDKFNEYMAGVREKADIKNYLDENKKSGDNSGNDTDKKDSTENKK